MSTFSLLDEYGQWDMSLLHRDVAVSKGKSSDRDALMAFIGEERGGR